MSRLAISYVSEETQKISNIAPTTVLCSQVRFALIEIIVVHALGRQIMLHQPLMEILSGTTRTITLRTGVKGGAAVALDTILHRAPRLPSVY